MKIVSRILICLIWLLHAPISAFAQDAAAQKTVGRLSDSAEQELNRSIQELNKLRNQIASEKLPLAQELTALEEKLTQLRKEHERVTRLVESGSLEITTLKTGMKARQDELAYVGTLLDEYARSFESKINISELQYLGDSLGAAKQATENTTLPMPEKFTRQTEFVDVSIARLFDAIGGMKFEGVGVDMEGVVVEGHYTIIGPVVLFGGENGSAGVGVAQTGSTNPLIRPLDGNMQGRIAELVETGSGIMPLDPSRGGALKAFAQQTDVIQIFEKGGPIMWPLLLAAVLALGTVIERVIFLVKEQRNRNPQALEQFLTAVSNGEVDRAISLGYTSKFYVVRTLGYALEHKEKSLANAILYAQEEELKRFRRGVPILDTVITLAPLLGLLGTVTGMMSSFSLIGGDLGAPGAITGGIAEALIATAFGLTIAIMSLIPFNFLNTKMEEARLEVELAATQLELLVQPKNVADQAAIARLYPAEDL